MNGGAILRVLDSDTLKSLHALHGIQMDEPEQTATLAPVHVEKQYAGKDVDGTSLYQFSVQPEIGMPGTYIIDGRISVEQNYRIRPYFARGRVGRPGLLEDTYRSEPVVFNSINSVTALVCNATYEPVVPEGADEELQAVIKKAHNSLKNQRDGWQHFLRNASTAFKLGFAPFELVWADKYIHAVAFREQATVDQWLLDERQSRLVGVCFQLQNIKSYALPCGGGSPATERVAVCNINATGNNFEGVSPVRVVIGLRKLKELLLNISGVTYQKYGVPIAQVVRDLVAASAADLAEIGGAASIAAVQKTANQIASMDARIAPVIAPDTGVRVEYASPANQMPDIRPMLEYIDQLMALVMSNEGAMLGTSSFGSYALASVADNRFMRSAPVYAGAVAEFLTKLLHMMVRWNYSGELIEMPYYSFRFAGTQDASRWAADMQVLVAAQVWTWPDEARRMAAANMGLSVRAFDAWVADTTSPDVSGQVPADITVDGADIQDTALNGAQVTSMVDIISQVSQGLIPRASAVKILQRAFQLSPQDADALVGTAGQSFTPEQEVSNGLD